MVKKLLFILGGIIALIVIAAIAAVMLIDVNSYKPKIETAAFDATGLELKINGKLGISLFPVGVSANDIHVSNKQGQIVGLKKLTIGVEVMPLLKKEIKVSRCDLENPVISIVKETNGKFNFEVTEKTPAKKEEKKDAKGAAASVFIVESFNIVNGNLVYEDKKAGDKTELKDFNLNIKNFDMGAAGGDMMKQLAFTGNFSAKELQQKKIIVSNIKSTIKASNGALELNPFSFELFKGKGDGDVRADMSGSTMGIKLDFKLTKFNLETLEDALGQKRNIGGDANMALAITAHGKEQPQIMSSLNGKVSVTGDNLILYTMDIDRKLEKIEGKQGSMNVLDLGTVFGLDTMFGTAQQTGERGAIKKLVSDWKLTNGTAETTDVAVSTVKHRLAMKGKINLVSERYENLVIAVIDAKGCSTMKQTLNGPLKKPKIDTKEALQSIATGAASLFGLKVPQLQNKPAQQDTKCDNFYSGSVQPPK